MVDAPGGFGGRPAARMGGGLPPIGGVEFLPGRIGPAPTFPQGGPTKTYTKNYKQITRGKTGRFSSYKSAACKGAVYRCTDTFVSLYRQNVSLYRHDVSLYRRGRIAVPTHPKSLILQYRDISASASRGLRNVSLYRHRRQVEGDEKANSMYRCTDTSEDAREVHHAVVGTDKPAISNDSGLLQSL